MKLIPILLLFISNLTFSQGIISKIGTSSCRCEEHSVENIVTFIQVFDSVENTSQITELIFSNYCEIQDTIIIFLDSLERQIEIRDGKKRTLRTYDIYGQLIRSVSYLPTDTLDYTSEIFRENGEVTKVIEYINGEQVGVTNYSGRKTVKTFPIGHAVKSKFNKDKKPIWIKCKYNENEKKQSNRKVKYKYDSSGKAIKFVSKENGHNIVVTTYIYDGGRIRRATTTDEINNRVITTNYMYESY